MTAIATHDDTTMTDDTTTPAFFTPAMIAELLDTTPKQLRTFLRANRETFAPDHAHAALYGFDAETADAIIAAYASRKTRVRNTDPNAPAKRARKNANMRPNPTRVDHADPTHELAARNTSRLILPDSLTARPATLIIAAR